MAKQKKKKKKNKVNDPKRRRRQFWAVTLALLGSAAFFLLRQMWLLPRMGEGHWFVLPMFGLLVYLVPVLLLLSAVLFAHRAKKSAVFFLLFAVVAGFLSTGVDVVTADKDGITRSLLPFSKTEYTYDDIESATLQIDHDVLTVRAFTWRSRTTLLYQMKMSDGKKLDLALSDAQYADFDDLIRFDKRVADKRLVLRTDWSFDDIDRHRSAPPTAAARAYFTRVFS